jgi:hypothetical protein
VSEACRNCWAEAVSIRMGLDVWGAHAARRLAGDAVFADVARWNKMPKHKPSPIRWVAAAVGDRSEKQA